MKDKENCLYIVKDGKLQEIEMPASGHGECKIIWKDNKILDIVKSERVRI